MLSHVCTVTIMEVLKILDPNAKIGKIKFTDNTDKSYLFRRLHLRQWRTSPILEEGLIGSKQHE
jgi:hypothetical protein